MNVHGKDEHAIDLREARPPGPLLQVKFDTITGNNKKIRHRDFSGFFGSHVFLNLDLNWVFLGEREFS